MLTRTVLTFASLVPVEFILNPARDDLLVKPYHECGNPKMYSAEGLRKRAALKEHNAVKDSLNRSLRGRRRTHVIGGPPQG